MINIAIMGFGIVGSGVATSITLNNEHYQTSRQIPEINIKYILDLRDFPDHPLGNRVVHDIYTILSDESVSIVVETMGGIHPAYDFSKRALECGKSVVTSNKAVVAAHGAELFEVAKNHNVSYLFEASVGGGIPIIRPLWQCLASNNIMSISGILNGTCNYILTRMKEDKLDLNTALFQAQELGYAEKDPTADIEGMDTCRKICILSSLAFGKTISPEDVHCEGITSITLEDIENAKTLGATIKLLGNATRYDNGKLDIITAPYIVPFSHQLSHVDDVYNAIGVVGNLVGDVMFCGKGAGSLATASAVVADVINIIANKERRTVCWKDQKADFVIPFEESLSSSYIRTNSSRQSIENAFGNVKLNETKSGFYFTTLETTEKKLESALSKLDSGYTRIRLLK